MQKSNKRKYLIGALAVLLVAVVVGGTVAWLTAANYVNNSFTVGEINPPEKDDGGDPVNPPENPDEGDGEKAKLEGNIYEITDDLKVIPGSDSTKKPWIGIGPKSEDAYVFAYVDNNMMSATADPEESSYFVLNAGWVPVEGNATAYDGVGNAYKEGLFVWCGTGGGTTPVAIEASETENVWTPNPVFDTVVYPNNPTAGSVTSASDYSKDCTMDVWCYIYADVNNTTPDAAIDSARAWLADKADGTDKPKPVTGTATATQEP